MQLDFPVTEIEDPAQLEAGRRLFSKTAEFVTGAVALQGLPPDDRVEVCFAGRSNVGKSSLINALTGQKSLARTSNTPGRTQQLNFFDLNGQINLVDLPGYGFARAPLKSVKQWQQLQRDYLAGRPNLRRAFVLLDARHGVKTPDEEIMQLLDRSAVTFQAVLTKTDKVKRPALETVLDRVRSGLGRHPASFPEIALTSAEKGDGIEALRAVIAGIE